MQLAAPDELVAVLLLGISGFREINETLGHDHGDEILQMVAACRVATFTRLVTPARFGGDEFALLLRDVRGVGAAYRAADVIVTAYEDEPFEVADLVIEVGVRVGVAVFPDHTASAPHLLRPAQRSRSAPRRTGARSVSVFSSIDDPDTTAQLTLAHKSPHDRERGTRRLRTAVLGSRNQHGHEEVEALVRWIQPDGTVVPPDVFISVAERTGLIRPLTKLVRTSALEHRKQWVAAGYDIAISVNASVRDLVDPVFPEEVAVTLTRAVSRAPSLTAPDH